MIPALVDLLAIYHQNGNMAQMEVIARSLLAAIPDDLVGLQFLGLALYRRGREAEALLLFRRAVAMEPALLASADSPANQTAALATYREATRPGAPLSGAWKQLKQLLVEKKINPRLD